MSAPVSPTSSCLDMPTLEELRRMMGAKFATIMSLYLKDAGDRIGQLESITGIEAARETIGQSAHSLKSASAHVGAAALSDLARQLELAADNGAAAAELQALIGKLRGVFTETQALIQPLVSAS